MRLATSTNRAPNKKSITEKKQDRRKQILVKCAAILYYATIKVNVGTCLAYKNGFTAELY